jgi:hypothetical protein
LIAFGFSGIYKKNEERRRRKKQHQTIRKLSESKEAESIRLGSVETPPIFSERQRRYIAHNWTTAAARIVLHCTHTHIVTHSSRSRSTLYILYNTIPAGGWSKKEKGKKGKRESSHSFVYTPTESEKSSAQ